AVRNGHKLVVRLLIRSGLSSFNPEDSLHKLLCAIRFRQTAVVQLLLESVNINYNWTPLLLAVEKGYKDMVQLLLEYKNIYINIRDHLGRTLLL
ncbi:uncharacterized protein K441DRAFT_591125, partial [Cenococcum geophilum 1.58]